MHTAYISAQTAERRKQNVEDVRKRSEYRKAHGLDKEGVFGGWTAKTDEESLGPALREGGVPAAAAADLDASPVAHLAASSAAMTNTSAPTVANGGDVSASAVKSGGEEYVDFEGRRKPVKKWLGIW